MQAKIALAAFALIFSSLANAAVVNPPSSLIAGVSVSGDVRMIDAPGTDVSFGLYENNDTAFLWKERTRTVDSQYASLLISGLAAGEQTLTAPGPAGELDAGTYSSYFLHMESDVETLGGAQGTIYAGTITFKQEILGLIYNRFENCQSHDVFGDLSTTYPEGGASCSAVQNFDFAQPADNWLTISADRKTIQFSQYTAYDMDQIRILTAVPVPAAVWMFGSGLGLLGWMRRRAAVKA
jgi:hypothetical protein